MALDRPGAGRDRPQQRSACDELSRPRVGRPLVRGIVDRRLTRGPARSLRAKLRAGIAAAAASAADPARGRVPTIGVFRRPVGRAARVACGQRRLDPGEHRAQRDRDVRDGPRGLDRRRDFGGRRARPLGKRDEPRNGPAESHDADRRCGRRGFTDHGPPEPVVARLELLVGDDAGNRRGRRRAYRGSRGRRHRERAAAAGQRALVRGSDRRAAVGTSGRAHSGRRAKAATAPSSSSAQAAGSATASSSSRARRSSIPARAGPPTSRCAAIRFARCSCLRRKFSSRRTSW